IKGTNPFRLEDDAAKASKEEARKDLLAQSATRFREVAADPALADAPFPQRYALYKAAQVTAKLAELDPTQATAAIDALNQFRTQHADSWEILPAGRALAQLQERRGDLAGALKTYDELVALPALPKEAKQECELLAARMLLRGKKYKDAEGRL